MAVPTIRRVSVVRRSALSAALALLGGAPAAADDPRHVIVDYRESADALQPIAAPCVTVAAAGRPVGTWPLVDDGTGGDPVAGDGHRAAFADLPVGVPLALAVHGCADPSPIYETTLVLSPASTEPQIHVTGGPIGFAVRTESAVPTAPPLAADGGPRSSSAVAWLLRGLGATVLGGLAIVVARRLRRRPPGVVPLGRRTGGALFGLAGFPQRPVAWVVPEDVRAELLVAAVRELAAWGPVLVLPRASTRPLLAEVPTAGAWQMAAPRPDPRDVRRAAVAHHAAILVEGPEALAPPLDGEAAGAVLEELARTATGPLLVIARPGEPIPPRLRALVFERDGDGFRVDGARVEWSPRTARGDEPPPAEARAGDVRG